MTARLEEQEALATVEDDVRSFSYQLVNGVLDHKKQLDSVIQKYAPEWPLEQLPIIDRNVLRMALYEFGVWGETSVRVAINEAIELAKDYGSESASRFVNGVLGALVNREDELRAMLKPS